MSWYGRLRGRPQNPRSQAVQIASLNPVGTSGGVTGGDGHGMPLFQNHMWECRGFMTVSGGSASTTFTTLDANGWPTTDWATAVLEGFASLPTWATGTFKCGYTSKNGGAETITGQGSTIANKAVNGNLVTFDLTPTGTGVGFTIAGTTGGTTDVFVNLPGYPTSTGTGLQTFTTEAISILSNFGMQRGLDWSNSLQNSLTMTSANRNTLANTHAIRWDPFSLGPNGDGFPIELLCDLCNQTNTGLWWTLPVNDDGTYLAAVLAVIATRLNSWLPVRLELGNELWNNVGVGGGFWAKTSVTGLLAATPGVLDWDNTMLFTGTSTNGSSVITGCSTISGAYQGSGHNVQGPGLGTTTSISSFDNTAHTVTLNQNAGAGAGAGTFGFDGTGLVSRYYGLRLHDIGVAAAAAFGAAFGSRVKVMFAWQTGWGFASPHVITFNFFVQNYGAANLKNFIQGTSSAPYFSRDNTLVPGDGVNHKNHTGDSAATILSQVSANATYQALLSQCESLYVLGAHYGCDVEECYESFWEIGGDTTGTGIGAAIMDAGMVAVTETYYTALFNSGITHAGMTSFGVSNTSGGTQPGYQMSDNYDNFVGATGSPKLTGAKFYSAGWPTPTRNVVSGSGSVVSGVNYLDNISALSSGNAVLSGASAWGTGQSKGWIINCTAPGTYSLVANFTNSSGSAGAVGLECNTAVVASGSSIAVPGSVTNSPITLGNVTLRQGVNYVSIGNFSSSQPSISITQLQFN